jgi:hypothetical protein
MMWLLQSYIRACLCVHAYLWQRIFILMDLYWWSHIALNTYDCARALDKACTLDHACTCMLTTDLWCMHACTCIYATDTGYHLQSTYHTCLQTYVHARTYTHMVLVYVWISTSKHREYTHIIYARIYVTGPWCLQVIVEEGSAVCIHVCMHVCMHICVHLCFFCLFVCLLVCMYVHVNDDGLCDGGLRLRKLLQYVCVNMYVRMCA